MNPFTSLSSLLLRVTATVLAVAASVVAADFPELLKLIPDSANAIILVHADNLFSSDIAQRENWRQKYADEFEVKPLLLPPTAQQFVMAAEVQIPQMVPVWEMATMNLSAKIDPQRIVAKWDGVLDQIEGKQVVWVPDAAIILNSDTQAIVMSPLSRQAASRLIGDWGDQTPSHLSPYLREAAVYAEGQASEIILAIDLTSVFSVDHVKQIVEASPFLHGLDVETCARRLASIRGVTFGCKVRDKLNGAVKFDFAEDVDIFKEVGRTLVLQIMEEAGASLSEFEQWKCTVAGNRIQLTGEMTKASMRRMFSLFSLDAMLQTGSAPVSGEGASEPTADGTTPQHASPDAADVEAQRAKSKEVVRQRQEQRRRDACLKYFNAVNQYVDDVINNHPEDIADIAFWLQNYARRISRLSRSNVDPELTKYGKYISGSFQQIVGILEGVQEQINYRASQIDPTSEVEMFEVPVQRYTTGGPVGWGYGAWGRGAMYGTYRVYEYAPMYRQRLDYAEARKEYDQIAEQEQARGKKEIQKILDAFAQEEQYMRDRMTEKYGVSF